MTTLSSLLVARKAATIDEMDEALERQVVHGGDLATSLLEVGTVLEQQLVPLLGEAFGIEPAPCGELPHARVEVLRLVPRAVALRYGIYPLEERDGELSVVVSEPLPASVEDDLGFALGARLRPRVAPLVRIHQAIFRDYGGQLEPRYSKLISKLEAKAPSNAAGDGHRTRASPATPPYTPMSLAIGDAVLAETHRALSPAATPRHTWPGVAAPAPAPSRPLPREPTRSLPHQPPLPFSREPSLPHPPEPQPWLPLPPEPPLPLPPEPPHPPELPLPHPPEPPLPFPCDPPLPLQPEPPSPPLSGVEQRAGLPPPPAEFVMEAMMATAAQVEKQRHRRAARPSGQALVGWARRAVGDPITSDRAAERRRGPLTPADAERELEGANAAEQALAIFFAFARQYFEYSALFVVHGDLAEGNDGWGPGASRDKVRGIGVALDLPSTLSHARAQAVPLVTLLAPDGLDAGLREDLQRSAPAQVLIMPILVRGRCVGLFYGDDGEQPVQLSDIGEVLAMAPLVERALQQILLRKKRSGPKDPGERVSAPRPPPPPIEPPKELEPEVAGRSPSAAPRKSSDDTPEITVGETTDEDELLAAVLDGVQEPARSASPMSIEPGVASGRVAVEPHPPPASRLPYPELPSVLIRSELVDQVIAGGEEGERALGEILALGEAAIPSVFARFPGPLVVDRAHARGELPRPADCGPVLRIAAAMRRLALPFLAVRSADVDPEVRFWATYLLGELHYPDAAAALVPRLFDENPAVRRIAIRSGRALVAGEDEASLPLRRSLERMIAYPDEPERRRLVAIGIVGELRVYRCIPALIAALSDASRLVVETAAHTLTTMTRLELGPDARRWGEWWETKGRKRLS